MIRQEPLRPSFFDLSTEAPDEARIVLAGFTYDCTASFRAGTRFGPRDLRSYPTEGLETFSFYFGEDLEDASFYDAGDMEPVYGDPLPMIEAYKAAVFEMIKGSNRLLAIGGEHLVSYPLFLATRERYGDFTLLHLDAHADLATVDHLGCTVTHGTVMNLCLEAGLPLLIQYGIRSGNREEYERRQTDERIIPAESISEIAEALTDEENVYLSIDVDFFDPAYVPGTGTPEAGGATFGEFIKILRLLREKKINLIGCDLVELAPEIDPTRNSTIFVGKVLRELLLTMDKLYR